MDLEKAERILKGASLGPSERTAVSTLRARVAELEAVLEQNWEHAIGCPAQRFIENDVSSCTCGLWQILNQHQINPCN